MNYDTELLELKAKSVDRLICAEVYDKDAFDALGKYTTIRVREEKGNERIPRQLLQVLNTVVHTFESKVQYLPELKGEEEMIHRFNWILGCLISDEDPDERQSGVPRII